MCHETLCFCVARLRSEESSTQIQINKRHTDLHNTQGLLGASGRHDLSLFTKPFASQRSALCAMFVCSCLCPVGVVCPSYKERGTLGQVQVFIKINEQCDIFSPLHAVNKRNTYKCQWGAEPCEHMFPPGGMS